MNKIKSLFLIFIVLFTPIKFFSMEEAAAPVTASAENPETTRLIQLKIQASLEFLKQAGLIFDHFECEENKEGFFTLYKALTEKATLAQTPQFQHKLESTISFVKYVELALFKLDLICNKIAKPDNAQPNKKEMFTLNQQAFTEIKTHFFEPEEEELVPKDIVNIRIDHKIITDIILKHLTPDLKASQKDYLNVEKYATYDPLFIHDYLYLQIQTIPNDPKKQQDLLASINHAVQLPKNMQPNKTELVAILKYGLEKYKRLTEVKQEIIVEKKQKATAELRSILEILEGGLADNPKLAAQLPIFAVLKNQMETERSAAKGNPEELLSITKKYTTHFDLLAKAGEALKLKIDNFETTIHKLMHVGLAQFAITIDKKFKEIIDLLNGFITKESINAPAKIDSCLTDAHQYLSQMNFQPYIELADNMSKYNISVYVLTQNANQELSILIQGLPLRKKQFNALADIKKELDEFNSEVYEELEKKDNAIQLVQTINSLENMQKEMLKKLNYKDIKFLDATEYIETQKQKIINIFNFNKPVNVNEWYKEIPANVYTELAKHLYKNEKQFFERLNEDFYNKYFSFWDNEKKILENKIGQEQGKNKPQATSEKLEELKTNLQKLKSNEPNKDSILDLGKKCKEQLPGNWHIAFYNKKPKAAAAENYLIEEWHEALSAAWERELAKIASKPLKQNRYYPLNIWLTYNYELPQLPQILQPLPTDDKPLNEQLLDGLSELANKLTTLNLTTENATVATWIRTLRDENKIGKLKLYKHKDAKVFATIYKNFMQENGDKLGGFQKLVNSIMTSKLNKVPALIESVTPMITDPLLANISDSLKALKNELDEISKLTMPDLDVIIPQIIQFEQKVATLQAFEATIITPVQELIKQIEAKPELNVLKIRLNQISSSANRILEDPKKCDNLFEEYKLAEYLAKKALGQIAPESPEFKPNLELLKAAETAAVAGSKQAPATQQTFVGDMSFYIPAEETQPEEPLETQMSRSLNNIRKHIMEALKLKLYDDAIALQNILYEANATTEATFDQFLREKQPNLQVIVKKIDKVNQQQLEEVTRRNLEERKQRGNTKLLQAAEENNPEAIKTMQAAIAEGADINAVDKDKFTALMHAIQNNNVEIITWLLTKAASPNIQTPAGITALMTAAASDDIAAVKLLLGNKLIDPNIKDAKGKTALMRQINLYKQEQPINEILQLLIKCPQNTLEQLQAAAKLAQDSDKTDLAKLITTERANKMLLDAAAKNDATRVKEALAFGADIYTQNSESKTALELVTRDAEAFKALRQHEAQQVKRKTSNKLLTAVENCNSYEFEAAIQEAYFQGANINATNAAGKTALVIAAEKYDPENKQQEPIYNTMIKNLILFAKMPQAEVERVLGLAKDGWKSTKLIDDNLKEKIKRQKEAAAPLTASKVVEQFEEKPMITPSEAFLNAVDKCDLPAFYEGLAELSDINVQDKKGNTALMIAVQKFNNNQNDYFRMIERLTENEKMTLQEVSRVYDLALANQATYTGFRVLEAWFKYKIKTQLWTAASSGNLVGLNEAIQWFNKYNWETEINAKNPDGYTALALAVYYIKPEIVTVLLQVKGIETAGYDKGLGVLTSWWASKNEAADLVKKYIANLPPKKVEKITGIDLPNVPE